MNLRQVSRVQNEDVVPDSYTKGVLLFYQMQNDTLKMGLLGHKDLSFMDHCYKVLDMMREAEIVTGMDLGRKEFKRAVYNEFWSNKEED